MGNIFSVCLSSVRAPESRYAPEERDEPKLFSWDRKEKLDPKDFIFNDVEHSVSCKGPGTVNGQQFIIQNCKDSVLGLFDYCASVQIDDCSDCRIVIGPCKGSVFIRDCCDCNLLIACQQLRTRDCRNLNLFLHCATQPIIESSVAINFACLQWDYPGLKGHYNAANLSVFDNLWSQVHDFTPIPGNPNFAFLPEDSNPLNYVSFESSTDPSIPQLSSDPSIVPLSIGCRKKPTLPSVQLILFADKSETAAEKATNFLISARKRGLQLIQSKEVRMQASDIERILHAKELSNLAKYGSVVSVEVCGEKSTSVDIIECIAEANAIQSNLVLDGDTIKNAFINFCSMKNG